MQRPSGWRRRGCLSALSEPAPAPLPPLHRCGAALFLCAQRAVCCFERAPAIRGGLSSAPRSSRPGALLSTVACAAPAPRQRSCDCERRPRRGRRPAQRRCARFPLLHAAFVASCASACPVPPFVCPVPPFVCPVQPSGRMAQADPLSLKKTAVALLLRRLLAPLFFFFLVLSRAALHTHTHMHTHTHIHTRRGQAADGE